MTDLDFRAFVESRRDEFKGVHPHSSEELDRFEHELGHPVPESLRWLLGTFGYSDCCGVDNLEEAVRETLDCRTSISLPQNWLVLNDLVDGVTVVLELVTGRICWCGGHNVHNLASGEIDDDSQWFEGYPEWVAYQVELYGQ